MRRQFALLTLLLCTLLVGCEQLGIESPAAAKANKEADSKAVGGACRHAGRAIEDCYTLNKKSDRAAMYAGWREMNEYMRENKLEPVVPVIPPEPPKPPPAPPAKKASEPAKAEGDDDEAEAGPSQGKTAGKSH